MTIQDKALPSASGHSEDATRFRSASSAMGKRGGRRGLGFGVWGFRVWRLGFRV